MIWNNLLKTAERVIYFFPLQLFFAQIKKNILLLIIWGLLFGFITQSIGLKYGIPYLFLSPEYHGSVGFLSFFIMGLCFGAFIMTYNIASYVTNGSRFRFIATLNRPFLKYSLNNSSITAVFIGLYSYLVVKFQIEKELESTKSIIMDIFGLHSGISFFLFLSYVYFFSTNKNIFQLFGITPSTDLKETLAKLESKRFKKKHRLLRLIVPSLKLGREWKVITYISNPFSIRLARGAKHYTDEVVVLVFNQNQNNAAWFQILIFLILLTLGLFQELSFFDIPAGGSILLLLTMFLIIVSVLQTWLRGWFAALFLALIVLFNYVSQYSVFDLNNKAYGLNYNTEKAEYSNAAMQVHTGNIDQYIKDIANTKLILEKWKIKNKGNKKGNPKMVIICASGGGIKSAVWTFSILQKLDSITNGRFFTCTQLMTGSSGGIIGSTYYRELYLRRLNGEIEDLYKETYLANISKDLLNPIASSLTLNDLFLKFQKVKIGNYSYPKDRGYAFEQQLIKNTEGVLNKTIGDYKIPEEEGLIPMMIMSPTIVNDGRRLLISPQPISYLVHNKPSVLITNTPAKEDIEFRRFFMAQNADNLRLSSALRMSSTFPYIMPLVSLPSYPMVEAIDAGARDNYGLKTAMKFIYSFRKWLDENTSGLIIVQIRERSKEAIILDAEYQTMLQEMLVPIASFYDNLFNIQNFNNDSELQYASQWYMGKIDVIDFQLSVQEKQDISLSWHLANKEKAIIKKALELKENQDALKRLTDLLK